MATKGTGGRLIEDYLPLDELNSLATIEKKHPKHRVALVHYCQRDDQRRYRAL